MRIDRRERVEGEEEGEGREKNEKNKSKLSKLQRRTTRAPTPSRVGATSQDHRKGDINTREQGGRISATPKIDIHTCRSCRDAAIFCSRTWSDTASSASLATWSRNDDCKASQS